MNRHRMELRHAALQALIETNPADKVLQVATLRAGVTDCDVRVEITQPAGVPGQPAKPDLISALAVPRRRLNSPQGRAALVHAITHIEFNAINLALDAAWRFANMPPQFYRDWLHVAAEEAYHFNLLRTHLQRLGFDYGSFPAHNGLWEMTEKTQNDVLARMALVPRTLEARGLDANPLMRQKLAQAGDERAAEILDIILRDEIGHVAIGNHWYRYCCEQAGFEPIATYAVLSKQYNAPRLRAPFNLPARRAAGFDEAELRALES